VPPATDGGDGRDATLEALERLDSITRRLRRECPWDREQDERSIVPHTVEEAYELGQVAEGMSAKLIRRHPHVFGAEAGAEALAAMRSRPETAGQVLGNWDRIKRDVEGRGKDEPFADVPENLPALLYARKILRRADPDAGSPAPTDPEARDAAEAWVGEVLLAVVGVSRRLGVDPELALRAAADRYRDSAA
jgi:uncharacterized protein YabN with tetrapyrrole methylase and pyrophosphatase domain